MPPARCLVFLIISYGRWFWGVGIWTCSVHTSKWVYRWLNCLGSQGLDIRWKVLSFMRQVVFFAEGVGGAGDSFILSVTEHSLWSFYTALPWMTGIQIVYLHLSVKRGDRLIKIGFICQKPTLTHWSYFLSKDPWESSLRQFQWCRNSHSSLALQVPWRQHGRGALSSSQVALRPLLSPWK